MRSAKRAIIMRPTPAPAPARSFHLPSTSLRVAATSQRCTLRHDSRVSGHETSGKRSQMCHLDDIELESASDGPPRRPPSRVLRLDAGPIRTHSSARALRRASAPVAIVARPARLAEARALMARATAGALKAARPDARRPAGEACESVGAVALAIHTDTIPRASTWACAFRTVVSRPALVAPAGLVDARAMARAARWAQGHRAIQAAESRRAMASAIVALAVRRLASRHASGLRTIDACEARKACASRVVEAGAVARAATGAHAPAAVSPAVTTLAEADAGFTPAMLVASRGASEV
mmetsp:Transcript_38478/g.101494  ORF Transcript_38478/g.101494 Transcript_38478/m.101494 type:complete len:296 (-) Transcript_38478:1370-2257(-)